MYKGIKPKFFQKCGNNLYQSLCFLRIYAYLTTQQWVLKRGHASPGNVNKFPGVLNPLHALQHEKLF